MQRDVDGLAFNFLSCLPVDMSLWLSCSKSYIMKLRLINSQIQLPEHKENFVLQAHSFSCPCLPSGTITLLLHATRFCHRSTILIMHSFLQSLAFLQMVLFGIRKHCFACLFVLHALIFSDNISIQMIDTTTLHFCAVPDIWSWTLCYPWMARQSSSWPPLRKTAIAYSWPSTHRTNPPLAVHFLLHRHPVWWMQ